MPRSTAWSSPGVGTSTSPSCTSTLSWVGSTRTSSVVPSIPRLSRWRRPEHPWPRATRSGPGCAHARDAGVGPVPAGRLARSACPCGAIVQLIAARDQRDLAIRPGLDHQPGGRTSPRVTLPAVAPSARHAAMPLASSTTQLAAAGTLEPCTTGPLRLASIALAIKAVSWRPERHQKAEYAGAGA